VGVLFGVAPLLVPQEHDRATVEAGRAADQGRVVGEQPISVQLQVLLEDGADVVKRVRPLGVTGDLDPLPGRQARRRRRAVRRRESGAGAIVGAGIAFREALLNAGQDQAPFQAATAGWPV
jgi:hypothetical protein